MRLREQSSTDLRPKMKYTRKEKARATLMMTWECQRSKNMPKVSTMTNLTMRKYYSVVVTCKNYFPTLFAFLHCANFDDPKIDCLFFIAITKRK